MKAIRRFSLIAALSVALLAVAAFAGSLTNGAVRAQTGTGQEDEAAQEQDGAQRVIHVNGVGVVSAQPDQAVVTFGVQTQADSAADALEENSTLMQEVISATVGAGIDEDNIQTQYIRLDPVYDEGPETTGTPSISGYRASNSVSVTVQDLDGLGDLLDTVVQAGANTIEGIRFEISDRQALAAEAREAAVADAREKAEQLAELTGAELGEVLTVSEAGATPPPEPFLAEDAAVGGAGVPVSPGAENIEARVQISWLLE